MRSGDRAFSSIEKMEGSYKMSNVSVVVTTYRRFDTLEEILYGWCAQSKDVILANGGEHFKTDLPIRQVVFSPDQGNKIRFIAGMLSAGERVIFADDDIIPEYGLLRDLESGIDTGLDFAGIFGRQFNNPEYIKCSPFRSDKISDMTFIQMTDFVGVVFICDKWRILEFDPMKIPHRSLDDLYFQCKTHEGAIKGVVRTKLYKDLSYPQSDDLSSCRDPEAQRIRWKFYKDKIYNVSGGKKWDITQ